MTAALRLQRSLAVRPTRAAPARVAAGWPVEPVLAEADVDAVARDALRTELVG